MHEINFMAKNNQYQVNQANEDIKGSLKNRAGKFDGGLSGEKITLNVFSSLLSLCLVLFLFSTALAQSAQNTKNTADQTLRSNGRVNPASLGMEMDIPLGAYPARGINLPLGISYSSKLWRFQEEHTVYKNNAGTNLDIFASARYSDDAAAGWTTSLSQPFIEYTGEKYRFTRDGKALSQDEVFGPIPPPARAGDSYVKRITVFLPGGGSHELRAQEEPIAINLDEIPSNWNDIYYAVDGSGLKYVEDAANGIYKLWMPDGSFYTFKSAREDKHTPNIDGTMVRRAERLTDAHGNYAEFKLPLPNTSEMDDYPYGYWIDTLGRRFPVMIPRQTPTIPAGESLLQKSFKMPGIDPTKPYILRWKYLQGDTEANSAFTPNRNYELHYAGFKDRSGNNYGPSLFYTAADRFDTCSFKYLFIQASANVKFNPVVLSEVILPNGAKYKFTYNKFGEIEQIHYPTGGFEEIEYEPVASLAELSVPYQMSNRGVKTRKVYESVNDVDPDTWTYTAKTSANNYRTSTIAPDGTQTDRFMHRGVQEPPCTQPDPSKGVRWGYDNPLSGMAYEERSFSSSGQLMQRTLTKWTATQTTVSLSSDPFTTTKAQRNARTLTTETIIYEGNPGLSSATKLTYDTDADTLGSPLNVTKTTQYAFKVTSGGSGYSPALATQAPPDAVQVIDDPTGSMTAVKSVETAYLYNTSYGDRNILKLPLEIIVTDGQNNPKAKTSIQYDQTGRLESASVTNAPGWANPNTSVRGLPTTTTVWEDVGVTNEIIETYTDYDQFGNVRKTYNGNGMTETRYIDNFSAGGSRNTYAFPTEITSPQVNGTSFVTTTKYEYETGLPIAVTDPNGLETRTEYNDPLRRPTKASSYYQNQPVGGGAETIYGVPDSSGQFPSTQRFVKSRTQIDANNWKESYVWADGLGRAIKTQSVDADGGDVFTVSEYDRMGRVIKASNPFSNVSSPDCATNIHCTTTTYDAAGRVWKVKTADNAEVETTYGLATSGGQLGTVLTVTDQAEKPRRSITNALGQLIRVDEPDVNNNNQLGSIDAPNQPTYYLYDTLNDLTTVKQGGTFAQPVQTRSFVYDSLSRLKSANNPESGLIQYTYDKIGNLKTKRDARNIKTVYDYDALNRVVQRCYKALGGSSSPLGSTTCANNTETAEPNTPDVTYYYDGTYYDAQNTLQTATGAVKGKLTSVKSSVSKTNYTAFDVMGRVTQSQQVTGDTIPDPMTYAYNLAGALIEQKYPSGRVVRNVIDSNGDLATVQSKKNQNAGYWNYAQHFTYTAAGAVSSMQLGNGRWESTQFNNRLQPTQIALGSTENATDKLKLDFTYNTPNNADNNGNVLSQTITVPTEVGNNTTYNGFTATQTYTYDSSNRIKDAKEMIGSTQQWKQTFTYDRYGNRSFDESGTSGNYLTTTLARGCSTSTYNPNGICDKKKVNPTFTAGNNRIVQDQDNDSQNDYLFDSSGNTTKDANSNTYVYDGENKQVEVKNSSNQTIGQYWYGGDGKRIKKYVPETGETTIFVYDASGKMVAEYSSVVTQQSAAKVSYLTNDHLGSPRINTDKNGNITARHDYQPFGEEIQRASYGNDEVRKQFTSYERDDESDLDFAQARMYANKLGRFTTPDDFVNDSDVGDPQGWGKYLYVRNNPLTFTDPTGKCTPMPGKPCINSPIISGPNHVPKQPNRENVKDVNVLGYKDTANGGHLLMNVESQFAEGDNISDYRTLRTAILPGGTIRSGAEENPVGSQIAVDGNSKFVTDSPGLSVDGAPKVFLEGKSFTAAFVTAEYNTKTKTMGAAAYYGVKIVYGKDGKIDQGKSQVVTLTKEQFLAVAKAAGAKIPKNKDKQEDPELLLKQ
jgi:RHS repeat-associated protein